MMNVSKQLRMYSAVMVLLMAAAAQCQWVGDHTTTGGQILSPNPIACQCSDAAPRATVYYNVTYSCLQQLSFGSCDQDFTKNSQIAEMPEGWCQITCGRCPCCKSVSDVATAQGLTSLVSAAKIAGLDKQFAAPASMFTLLAPTDDAFTKALSTLGYATLDAVPASTLATILNYHIIPPHEFIDAVWTTPFFAASNGSAIQTAIPNAPLTFTNTSGNITVKGDSNSASITQADIVACKSYINIIDAVLLPPKNAAAPDLPARAGNIALGPMGPAPSAAQQAQALTDSALPDSPVPNTAPIMGVATSGR